MNATVATAPGRQDHPPQPVLEQSTQYEARRVGTLDRIALHVGVALIKWGRRPRVVASHQRRANRVEHELARLGRERQYERTARLMLPPLR